MATCSNCSNEAFKVYQVTSTYGIPYCSRHLPKFLAHPQYDNRVTKVEVAAPVVEAPIVEEPVVEEPVVEEVPVVEAPKASKKKAAEVTPEVEEGE